MECSEHVNSFIDVYWAYMYILKKSHNWKIVLKLVSFDTVTNPPKNTAFSNMASIMQKSQHRLFPVRKSNFMIWELLWYFKHLVLILDVSLWPSESNSGIFFGDAQVAEMLDLFKDLLEQNGCDMGMALTEWDTLEVYVQPLISTHSH